VTSKKIGLKNATPVPPKSKLLAVEAPADTPRDYLLAQVAASPHLGAASTVIRFSQADMGEVSLTDLVRVLKEQGAAINGGDLRNVEAMLSSQAVALNTVFAEMARRAALSAGKYLEVTDTYMKLALRAQSQCRATLETLAAIKNPPVVFAKQANIAHGHQQVNNGTALAYAKQTEKAPTELLEHDHGKRLDTGAATTAGGSDPALETVGAVHRSAQRRGQGRIKP
jgi:hypothetical protein